MKRILLSCFALMAIAQAKAQVVTDTVALGASYASQIWYSLENDNQETAPKNEWDLAFDVSTYGTSIHANTIIGTKVWTYPSGDTADWENVDITNIASWPQLYNSDNTWSFGALDAGVNTTDPYDVGWGIYNTTTHIVSGDSIFIIQLANSSYKKLWIESLNGGAFNFRYADIDGNNEQVQSLTKANFTGKNFGYFSLQNNAPLNREPLANDWDLLFTQYTAFIPQPYTVAGVLSNNGVTVAQADGVADPSTFEDYDGLEFTDSINAVGYDWKAYGSGWELEDERVYFVSSRAGNLWKVVFTNFIGSSTGEYIFTKEELSEAGLVEYGQSNVTFSAYPNPVTSGTATLVYNLDQTANEGTLEIHSLSGELVATESLNATKGMHSRELNTASMTQGVYIISLTFDGVKTQQRLAVQ